jgi:P-type E1-E2 ATPase
MSVASTTIAEDLAQVEYIFTDKTGTLTQNKMNLQMMWN